MSNRESWLADDQQTPVIDDYVLRLGTFVDTLADGQVDAAEMQAQEGRLAACMKEVESQLDDEMHAKVTRLLCELSAYNMMQMMHTLQEARTTTQFRG